ncbi:Uncharacterized protein FWK35_00006482 [Aphis craccivora]|uniref:Uncharacterized protein n=1 Tax=Aphis craccivora TaxID=307492 RepID=A0A6G0ZB05_APHCR|nr:Uncharacterized protein FWK35_00006482 [Aphis craccivora]
MTRFVPMRARWSDGRRHDPARGTVNGAKCQWRFSPVGTTHYTFIILYALGQVMGKGSSSDRARTRTTIGGRAAAAAVASDASTSTATVVVVQAVMRIPPPSSQTSSRPGIATRKSEGGILRLHVDDRGGGGARETSEREQRRVPEESGTGRAKKPDAAPSSLSTRGPSEIFFLRQ